MAASPPPANTPVTPPESAYPPVPQFSASGRPNTRAERVAFQIWVIMFLLVLVVTLLNYLIGWFFN